MRPTRMDEPLITESAMFHATVVVLVCAAVVIAVALAIDPLAGAIVLALELAVGTFLAIQAFRRRNEP